MDLNNWGVSLTAVHTAGSVSEWRATPKTSLSLTGFLNLKRPVRNTLPVSAGLIVLSARNAREPNIGRQEADI